MAEMYDEGRIQQEAAEGIELMERYLNGDDPEAAKMAGVLALTESDIEGFKPSFRRQRSLPVGEIVLPRLANDAEKIPGLEV